MPDRVERRLMAILAADVSGYSRVIGLDERGQARPLVGESRGTAMQQIADWLQKLGMSEYTHRFAENRIDLSILPDLTDQDLEKLGVLLGDRRKMLCGRQGISWCLATMCDRGTSGLPIGVAAAPRNRAMSRTGRRTPRPSRAR